MRRHAAAGDRYRRLAENLNFRYAITRRRSAVAAGTGLRRRQQGLYRIPRRIDQGEAPPLFVVGADGGSELVNYRVRGNYYIVDRLFAAAELRLGRKQQIVRISRTDAAQSKKSASLFGD